MHLVFYNTRRDERQEKEEQEILNTKVLRLSQAKNLTDINAFNLQNNPINSELLLSPILHMTQVTSPQSHTARKLLYSGQKCKLLENIWIYQHP